MNTIEPILRSVSNKLKETSTIITADRIESAVSGIRMVLNECKFPWSRKKYTLDVSSKAKEYDLTSLITDLDMTWGLHMIEMGGLEMLPCDYQDRALNSNKYYLLPDEKSIGFTDELAGNEVIDIWYYANLTKPAAYTTTLNLAIPDAITDLCALATKYIIHEGKRQRNDARNALIDYQAEKEKVVMKKAANKAHNLPKRVPNVFQYYGFNRTYPMD